MYQKITLIKSAELAKVDYSYASKVTEGWDILFWQVLARLIKTEK